MVTTMKTVLFALCLAAGLRAQCGAIPATTSQVPFLTVQMAFSTNQAPAVQGAPAPLCKVGISIQTTDMDAEVFTVTLSVRLVDGSTWGVKTTVERIATYGVPTYVEFVMPAGAAAPASVNRLDIVRLHSASRGQTLVYQGQ